METFIKMINKYGLIIVLLLSLVVTGKSCSTSQKLREHARNSEEQVKRMDSLITENAKNSVTKDDIILINNTLMKEYNTLIFGILNNKLSSDELSKKLKDIENGLIKIKNNNETKKE